MAVEIAAEQGSCWEQGSAAEQGSRREQGSQASLFEEQKAIGDRRLVIVVDNWGEEETVEETVEEAVEEAVEEVVEEVDEMYYHTSRLWRGEAR